MVRRTCRGLWPVGPRWEGVVSGLRPDDGGGVAIAYVDAGGGCLRLVGEVGWLAFKVGRQVHEPQHFEGVLDCMVLGCGLSSSVRLGEGGVQLPMMMVAASMAIWWYASARAWRKGSVASPKGTWVLTTLSCHPSPTIS